MLSKLIELGKPLFKYPELFGIVAFLGFICLCAGYPRAGFGQLCYGIGLYIGIQLEQKD